MVPGLGDFARNRLNGIARKGQSTPSEDELAHRRQIAQNARVSVSSKRLPEIPASKNSRLANALKASTEHPTDRDAFDTDEEGADESALSTILAGESQTVNIALDQSPRQVDEVSPSRSTLGEVGDERRFGMSSLGAPAPNFGLNYGTNDHAFNRMLEGMNWNRFNQDHTAGTNSSYPLTTSGGTYSSAADHDEQENLVSRGRLTPFNEDPVPAAGIVQRVSIEQNRGTRPFSPSAEQYERQPAVSPSKHHFGDNSATVPGDTNTNTATTPAEQPPFFAMRPAQPPARADSVDAIRHHVMRPHQQGRWLRPDPPTTDASILPAKRHHESTRLTRSDLSIVQRSASPALDYDTAKLKKMSFSELQRQDFDFDPAIKPTAARSSDALEDRLKRVLAKDPEQQRALIQSLNLADWERAGDWFLEQFGEVLKRYTESRKQKRNMTVEFEEEVARRHEVLMKKREAIEQAMGEMRSSGQGLLAGTPSRSSD